MIILNDLEKILEIEKQNSIYPINEEDFSFLFSNKELCALVSEPWLTGGMSGGNCWGDHARPIEIESYNEPEFDKLNYIINQITKNEVEKLAFTQLINQKTKEDSFTDYEYYGNYTEHSFQYVLFSDLLDTAKKFNDVLYGEFLNKVNIENKSNSDTFKKI